MVYIYKEIIIIYGDLYHINKVHEREKFMNLRFIKL